MPDRSSPRTFGVMLEKTDHKNLDTLTLRDLPARKGARPKTLRGPLHIQFSGHGRLTFRFTEERDFHPEELEIAQALATQPSLVFDLARLALAPRQVGIHE